MQSHFTRLRVLGTLCLTLGALGAQEADPTAIPWPDFRGPAQDGHAPAGAQVPLTWSDDENVRWKTELPGTGWSSPIVVGTTVWMTTSRDGGKELVALAVDLGTGQIVHDVPLFAVDKPSPKHDLNSYASPSPVAADGRVWVHFGTYGTACLESTTGDVLWRRDDIHCDHIVGPGSSPALHGGAVILHMDGGDEQYVIALDRASGDTLWRADRTTDFGDLSPDYRKCYSTPIFVDHGGRTHMISTGAQATLGYDPTTGEELWSLPHGGFSMSSRPVTGSGMVFLNTGYMKTEIVAMRLLDDGVEEVWRQRRGAPTMPSPLHIDGRLYYVSNGGIMTCVDALTGERVWHERIQGEHSASLLFATGRIYAFDRTGRTVVCAPGDEFEQLAANQLGDGFMASPAVVDNDLVLRTKSALYRIGIEPE